MSSLRPFSETLPYFLTHLNDTKVCRPVPERGGAEKKSRMPLIGPLESKGPGVERKVRQRWRLGAPLGAARGADKCRRRGELLPIASFRLIEQGETCTKGQGTQTWRECVSPRQTRTEWNIRQGALVADGGALELLAPARDGRISGPELLVRDRGVLDLWFASVPSAPCARAGLWISSPASWPS